MNAPSYGDVTQLNMLDLVNLMGGVRERIATAATNRDLDAALEDFAALRAEKERREAGGEQFVPVKP